MLAGHPDYPHHDVYEDDDTIAFLARYPTLPGYCLVAPKRHVESWVHDLDETQFLRLQSVVHQVARAREATVPTERMYALSPGSQQANAHLHWHVAPLPPGVPYDQQQFRALMAENGVLHADDDAQAALARAISNHLSEAHKGNRQGLVDIVSRMAIMSDSRRLRELRSALAPGRFSA